MPDDLLGPPPSLADSVPLAADEVVREGIALGADPVAEGRLVEASAHTGVPVNTLRAQPQAQVEDLIRKDVRMRAYQRDVDLAAWVATNPNYADISREDEMGLMRVRAATEPWLDSVRNAPTTAEKWLLPVLEIGQGTASGVTSLGRAAYGALSMTSDTVVMLAGEDPEQDEISRVLKDLLEQSDAQTIKASLQGRPLSEIQKETARQRENTASVLGITPGDVAGGFVSLAPTIAAGAATGGALWAILGAAALQSSGSMYADLRERGDDYGSSTMKAITAGAITAALTRIFPTAERALAAMFKAAPSKTVAARTAFSKVLGARAAGEMSEEALDEFAQSLIRGDSLAEAMEASMKAGLIGGIIGGTVGIGEARTAHRAARIDGAEAFHQSVDGLVTALDGSKTMERSPEVMKAYLQSVRPELKNAPAVFSGEDLQLAMQDPQVAEDLAAAGITAEMVAAAATGGGVIRTTQEKVLVGLPAETREKIRPLMRESADAMSRPEAEMAKEEQTAARAGSKIDEATKRTLKDISKERQRLIKELQTARGMAMTREDAAKVAEVAVQHAFTLSTRNASGGEAALAQLRKLNFLGKENLTDAEVRHRVTKLAGKDGKTALHGIRLARDLGAVAGRVDLLTGQVTINPDALVDQRQVDELLRQARGRTLDLQGRTVKVETEAGAAEVDAGAAVGTIRDRTEKMNRLRECLG